MFYHCLFLSTGILMVSHAFSQNEIVYNARSEALSYTSVTLTDAWSVTNNQAGLAFNHIKLIGINCSDRFMLSDLSTQTVIASLPVGTGSLGSSFSLFGSSPYHEEHFCIAYGRKLIEWFGAGIGLNYHYYTVEATAQTSSAITGDIGILAMPVEEIKIGLQVLNISKSKFNRSKKDELTSGIRFGFSYSEKEENYLLGVQIDWNNYKQINVRMAAECLLIKSLFIRFGVKLLDAASYSFGLGIQRQRILIDLGFEENTCLGLSSSISWIIELDKNGK